MPISQRSPSAARSRSQSSTSRRDQTWPSAINSGGASPGPQAAIAMPLCSLPLAPDQSIAAKRVKSVTTLPSCRTRFSIHGHGGFGTSPHGVHGSRNKFGSEERERHGEATVRRIEKEGESKS